MTTRPLLNTVRAKSGAASRRQHLGRLLGMVLCATVLLASCWRSGSHLGYSYHLGSDTVDEVDPTTTYAVGLGVLTIERGEAELISAHYAHNSGVTYTVRLVHLTGKQEIVGGGPAEYMLEPGNSPVDVPGFHVRVEESDRWELVIFARLPRSSDAAVDGGTLTYRDGSGRHALKLAGPIRLRRGSGPL